jgi:hypothetical protein
LTAADCHCRVAFLLALAIVEAGSVWASGSQELSIDGKSHSANLAFGTNVSHHNTKLDATAGVRIPADWESTWEWPEWVETIKKLTVDKDGDGRPEVYGVYWNVMMPQAGPVISTVAIFAFMHSWNNFLEPLIYLNRITKFTVPIGLSFFQESYGTEYTVLMAGTTVAVLPILIVCFLGQDYFVKGIVTTGLKG